MRISHWLKSLPRVLKICTKYYYRNCFTPCIKSEKAQSLCYLPRLSPPGTLTQSNKVAEIMWYRFSENTKWATMPPTVKFTSQAYPVQYRRMCACVARVDLRECSFFRRTKWQKFGNIAPAPHINKCWVVSGRVRTRKMCECKNKNGWKWKVPQRFLQNEV